MKQKKMKTMNKDIILIRPFRFAYISEFISTQEPISLCYLAAYLEKSGFVVDIWDLEKNAISDDELVSRLNQAEPFLVGFSCYTPSVSSANYLAQIIKRYASKITTVVGGPHTSALPKETLDEFPGFDIVVIGEGEATLLELAKKLKSGKDFTALEGIAFRDGNNIVQNKLRPLIHDIDTIPQPARHLLDWKLYKNTQPTRGFSTHDKKITSIYTSRGCPGKCIFCAANIGSGKRVRFRSVNSVLDEVEQCLSKYGIDHFVIQDDTFNLKPDRLSLILKGFKELGVNSWSCDARVDFVTKEILDEMVQAGCKKISFGVESGSPKIQKLNKKGITNDHVINAVNWARAAGLKCVETNFIIGSHPDETREDLMMSQALIKKINPDILFLSVIVPYPGTELFDIMNARGLIFSRDWNDYVFFGSVPKWRTNHFSPHDLVALQKKILRNYYLRPGYIIHNLIKISNLSDLKYWINSGFDFVRYNLKSISKKNT